MSGSYLIDQSTLTDICNAIRAKNGKTDKYKSDQLADEIMRINGFCATDENKRTELLFKANSVSVETTTDYLLTLSPESHLRIAGCTWTAETEYDIEDFYDALDTFKGIDDYGNETDTVNASGTIHVHFIHQAKRTALKNRNPKINILPDMTGYEVRYYSHDGTKLLYTEYLASGGTAVYDGDAFKEPDESHVFTHTGWSTVKGGQAESSFRNNVTSDIDVYAVFSSAPRQFVVSYYSYDGSSLIITENVPAGGTSVFEGEPEREMDEQYSYKFIGWSTEPNGEVVENAQVNITTDKSLYAVYKAITKIFTINFYNGEELLETQTVEYGKDAVFSGDVTQMVSSDGAPFKGWSPSPLQVKQNVDTYAQYSVKYTGENTEIEDSWNEIIQAVKDGTYVDKYSVGMTKPLTLSTGEVTLMEIVAMNLDKTIDGRPATISWLAKNPLSAYKPWCIYGSINSGYTYATIRLFLNDELYYQMPDEVKNALLSVEKKSGLNSGNSSYVTTTEKVWLASDDEVLNVLTSGGIYCVAFPDNASRIKRLNGTSVTNWWLRSVYSSSNADYITSSGAVSYTSCGSNNYIVFGFCI